MGNFNFPTILTRLLICVGGTELPILKINENVPKLKVVNFHIFHFMYFMSLRSLHLFNQNLIVNKYSNLDKTQKT